MTTPAINREPSIVELDAVVTVRTVARTPSPTPSEAHALRKSSLKTINWRAILRNRRSWYFLLISAFTIILTVLIAIYRLRIEKWLEPRAEGVKNFPGSWVFFIIVLFILSFPPLIGHELVGILLGFIWGLWIGFGILCAGTYIGEIANFYVFRYWLRGRADRLERSKITYGCLAKVIRDGGIKIAIITRYSIIPGHISTVLFSVCGINIFMFIIAVGLSLPKQLIVVYIGALLQDEGVEGSDAKNRKITLPVLFSAVAVALIAMWYLHREMEKVKSEVIYERRKARQAEALRRDIEASEGRSVLEGVIIDSMPDPQALDAAASDKDGEDNERPKKSPLSRIQLPSWSRFGTKSYQDRDDIP